MLGGSRGSGPGPGAGAAPGGTGGAIGEDDTIRSLRRMGIRAPKPYNPKRDPNFDAWLDRVVFHMSVSKVPDKSRTSVLLLLFDSDSFEAARHLGIQSTTDFDTAKEKLRANFVIMEPPEELKEKIIAAKSSANRSNHTRATSSYSDREPMRDVTLLCWKTFW